MTLVASRPRGSFALSRLAALIAAAAVIVALIIGAAILLDVYAPHTTGSAVRWVKDAGAWLTTPFHNVVNAHGIRHLWINWGIAAAVYLVGGLLIARVMAGTSRR
ncbi:MAG: hypothetical protein QOC82_2750 [Frankiaceae bacterium]|jgi:hypothetical protein|nr:hypothetical protein [Frankiaceae bacterium]